MLNEIQPYQSSHTVPQRAMPKKERLNPYKLCFYDVECDSSTMAVTLICFMVYCTTTGWMDFDEYYPHVMDGPYKVYYCYTAEQFQAFLIGSCKGMWYVMAFNGNKFDHLLMFDQFPWTLTKAQAMATSTSVKQLTYTHNGNTIVTRDLLLYITATSLEKLGVTLKWHKLDMHYSEITADNVSTYLMYCARDVTIMVKAWFDRVLFELKPVKGIIVDNVEAVIQFTSQAQIAFNAVVKQCHELYITDKGVYQYGKQAYYGAKCDSMVFGMHIQEPVEFYDIKSMYPKCMDHTPVGIPYYKYEHNVDWTTYHPHNVRPFLCTVRLHKPFNDNVLDMGFGVLPFRDVTNGCLHYLTSGNVKGVYTSVDIYVAILDGWSVISAYDFIVWPKWSTELFSFYQKWFDIKQSHGKTSPEYWFAKIILNSSIGMACLKYVNESIGHNCKPAQWGWFDLSATRLLLLQIKQQAAKANIKRILYGDTDSVCMTRKDMDAFVTIDPTILQTHLGNCTNLTGELEGESKEIIVLGKKMYYSGHKKACKGHNSSKMTRDVYLDALQGKDVLTCREMPRRSVYYCNKKQQLRMSVSPFSEHTRKVQVTIPVIKKFVAAEQCYINKYVIVH